ncbi:hypothetical protein [Dactylosporangium salmoneum]|uniref:Uncharacterized protein n=1 Tax=Dactylosporangium salmoneum TaxID=53361 RepID=A0ABN3FLF3_9ACTN
MRDDHVAADGVRCRICYRRQVVHDTIFPESVPRPGSPAGLALFTGISSVVPPALTGRKDTLYPHKSNAEYQAYVDGDPALLAVLAQIDGQPRTAQVARHVVSRPEGPGSQPPGPFGVSFSAHAGEMGDFLAARTGDPTVTRGCR